MTGRRRSIVVAASACVGVGAGHLPDTEHAHLTILRVLKFAPPLVPSTFFLPTTWVSCCRVREACFECLYVLLCAADAGDALDSSSCAHGVLAFT